MPNQSKHAWCEREAPSAEEVKSALFIRSKKGFAAACKACESTISGQSEEGLTANLDSHFKAHEPKDGYFWCSTCKVPLGTHSQPSTVDAHETCKKHTKERKTHLCLTCCTYNPIPGHASGTHEVVAIEGTSGAASGAAPSVQEVQFSTSTAPGTAADASFPAIMGQEMRITKKGKLSFNIPCQTCYPSAKFPSKETGINCNLCRLLGKPTPGKARVVRLAPPSAFMAPPEKPQETVTKAEWMDLDEEIQDLYMIPSKRAGKGALCRLDNDSWEGYKQEKSVLRGLEDGGIQDSPCAEDSDDDEDDIANTSEPGEED